MLQRDADWLFGLAYSLDRRTPVKDKKGREVVMIPKMEVDKMAEDLREFAAKYEATPEFKGRNK